MKNEKKILFIVKFLKLLVVNNIVKDILFIALIILR